MTDSELNKAIEVAGEAIYGGFADDDSFEQLLALAVLDLRDRLNNLKENVRINQINLLQRLNRE